MFMHESRFGTDQQCHAFLVQVRWNGRPQCPSCGNNEMNYYLSLRNIYKCSSCYKQFSVTQGTIFERSKIPLKKWFLAIYLFTTSKRGISSCQLAKWIGTRQKTAWFMLQRLREALKEENNIVLSGIVEADETFIYPKVRRDKRLQAARLKHEEEQDKLHGLTKDRRLKMGIKMKSGRKKGTTKEVIEQQRIARGGKPYSSDKPSVRTPFEKGVVILGMIERDGKVVMKKLGTDNRFVTKENIYPHLINHISKEAVFVTDQLNLYDETSDLFAQHLTVNHNVGYVVDGIHNNNIENAWKHLKLMVRATYFHISYHHFEGYLNENVYRWNRRKESEQSLFDSFIPLVAGKTASYNRLTPRGNKLAA